MTKNQLVAALATRAGLSRVVADDVVYGILLVMTDALSRGERIEIRDFAVFTVRERNAYTGRNPKTGVLVSVPAKRLPHFKAGRELQRRIAQPAPLRTLEAAP